VTTGTIGSLSGAFAPGSVGFYKTWSGGDGKVTTFAGHPATKWNNYTMSLLSWSVANLKWRMHSMYNETYPSNGRRLPWTYEYNDGFGFQSHYDWTSNDQLKLLEKLLMKVKSHDFNLGVNLGQMHQTVDLLATNLRKLGMAALLLKRGHFADAARQLGAKPRGTRLKTTDISGRWLEMQYGWLPLLGDSFEAAKAFEAISEGPRSQIFKVSRKVKGVGNGSQSPSYRDIPYEWSVRRQIIYEASEEMGFARQLGLLDPLSVAWELTPWSFLIDWFIPIGSYLDLVNAIPTLKGRFLTTEVKQWKTSRNMPPAVLPLLIRSIETPRVPFFENITGISLVPMVQGRKVEMTRTFDTSLSVPFPSMGLSGAIHGRRFWNAVSLAQQRFARVFEGQSNALKLARVVRTRYRSRKGRPGI